MTTPPTVRLTFDYWKDGDWYLGMVRELPCVHSQARSLEGLKAMLADAYVTMFPPPADEPFDGEAGPRLGTAELEFPYRANPLELPPAEQAELDADIAAESVAEAAA